MQRVVSEDEDGGEKRKTVDARRKRGGRISSPVADDEPTRLQAGDCLQ